MQTQLKERRVAERRNQADRRRKPLFDDVSDRRQQPDRRQYKRLNS